MDIFEFREQRAPAADAKTEALAHAVIGAAIEVHRVLGPGLPEVVYRRALSHELSLRHIDHVCEAPIPVFYKGKRVGRGKLDIFVADTLVVELKTAKTLTDVHRGQVIAYLQLKKKRLGLLINFNVAILKDGIKRVINSEWTA